jgi:hypothetical protein
LETRDASSYVSKLIIACVKLAPPDDWLEKVPFDIS